ncbi:protein transport protein SEC31-like [Plectropomus leopardus]|uniref:protein transport protein SEC31-like n=1 Tax=Plectropomus leopardus TaxID=160734 RepID=UPI001C4BBCD8|nr:protein transport protein SEC31-like [Plectropomus leopardus]
MTLTVRRRRAVQLQLDRVNESPVLLSQLPPQCGYSVQTTWRDLRLMAQYDACHIIQEDGSFVLPLLWRGTPVRMSCPASELQPRPPSVCCSPYGMTVRVQGLQTTEELRVNVRGEWTPLVELAEQCGYTLDRRDAEIVITAPFVTCGITVKDGKHTLPLQIGERTFTLSCPVSPPEELPLTHQPPIPHHETRGPAEHMPEPLEPFPWAPPFYLAPPYYPHPTNRHKYPNLDGNDAFNPPTPSSSTPEPTFGPLPLPTYEAPLRESYKHFGVHTSLSSTDDNEDSSRVHPDLQQSKKLRSQVSLSGTVLHIPPHTTQAFPFKWKLLSSPPATPSIRTITTTITLKSLFMEHLKIQSLLEDCL